MENQFKKISVIGLGYARQSGLILIPAGGSLGATSIEAKHTRTLELETLLTIIGELFDRAVTIAPAYGLAACLG
jgi:hypothetical protein